jgi:hypothetical protein
LARVFILSLRMGEFSVDVRLPRGE